jgi:hypothetical protein
MSGRVLVDPAQYLGSTNNDNLKNYIKIQRKQAPVCVLSFSLNPRIVQQQRIMEAGEMRRQKCIS